MDVDTCTLDISKWSEIHPQYQLDYPYGIFQHCNIFLVQQVIDEKKSELL